MKKYKIWMILLLTTGCSIFHKRPQTTVVLPDCQFYEMVRINDKSNLTRQEIEAIAENNTNACKMCPKFSTLDFCKNGEYKHMEEIEKKKKSTPWKSKILSYLATIIVAIMVVIILSLFNI